MITEAAAAPIVKKLPPRLAVPRLRVFPLGSGCEVWLPTEELPWDPDEGVVGLPQADKLKDIATARHNESSFFMFISSIYINFLGTLIPFSSK